MDKNIQNLQIQLNAAGFSVGTEDGILGNVTKNALKRAWQAGYRYINGKLTKDFQPSNYVAWTPESTKGSVQNRRAYTYDLNSRSWIPTKECAQWANSALHRYMDKRNRTLFKYDEVGGDAWTRLGAGKNTKMIYSGYEGMEYNPNKYSGNRASDERNWAAADNLYKGFDSKKLDKNKTYIVNMYYNDSPNKERAWRNALNGTTGTHTGNLYWNPKTNSWRVAHNIHGKIYDDDFISIQGRGHKYGVTAIAEPYMVDYIRKDWNKKHPIKALINKVYDFGMWKNGGKLIPKHQPGGQMLPEVTVTAINPKVADSKEGHDFIMALNNNRNYLMKKYNLTDNQYADLSRFAVNIASKESGLGSGIFYNMKRHAPDSMLALGKRVLRGNSGVPSRGITQIKYQSDIRDPMLKKEYDELGITDKGLETDPNIMAKATIARTMRGDIQLRTGNDGKPYTYSDGTIIPQNTARAILWNRGRLTSGKNAPTSNSDVGGATGYARRFEHQSVLTNPSPKQTLVAKNSNK